MASGKVEQCLPNISHMQQPGTWEIFWLFSNATYTKALLSVQMPLQDWLWLHRRVQRLFREAGISRTAVSSRVQKHVSSWGIMWYETVTPHVHVSCGKDTTSEQHPPWLKQLLLANTRRARLDSKSCNTQPIVIKPVVIYYFIYNFFYLIHMQMQYIIEVNCRWIVHKWRNVRRCINVWWVSVRVWARHHHKRNCKYMHSVSVAFSLYSGKNPPPQKKRTQKTHLYFRPVSIGQRIWL